MNSKKSKSVRCPEGSGLATVGGGHSSLSWRRQQKEQVWGKQEERGFHGPSLKHKLRRTSAQFTIHAGLKLRTENGVGGGDWRVAP